jgi:general secretion pathway protein D
VVDPAVIRGGQLSDMYLRDMSLREAFNEVLRVYDVAGEIKGNTLRVTLHEKFFSLDFLNSATGMNIASGGNVFGNSSGGAAGSSNNALSGNLTLTGTGGTKSDPYVEIENGVRAILGEDLRRSQQALGSSAATPAAGAGARRSAGGAAAPRAAPIPS